MLLESHTALVPPAQVMQLGKRRSLNRASWNWTKNASAKKCGAQNLIKWGSYLLTSKENRCDVWTAFVVGSLCSNVVQIRSNPDNNLIMGWVYGCLSQYVILYNTNLQYNTIQNNMTGQFDAAYHCPLDAIFPFKNILERSLVTKKMGTNVVLQSKPSRIHVVRC